MENNKLTSTSTISDTEAEQQRTAGCWLIFESKDDAKSFADDLELNLVDLENGRWGVRS